MGTGQDAGQWETPPAHNKRSVDHHNLCGSPPPRAPHAINHAAASPTPSQHRSFHPLPRVGMRWGPILPRFQICRGKDCQPGLGWIQPAIGLWQPLISPPAVHFPPQRSAATGSAEEGRVPSPVPRHPGSPNSTDPRELRDGRIFSRRNARFSLYLIPACSGWVAMELTAVPGCERVWGRKGLTRGSLLTLSNDLNQTERFCHPSR